MAFRRSGLMLKWTMKVALFSASTCGVPQNSGEVGGWVGAPVSDPKIPYIKSRPYSSSIGADYTLPWPKELTNREHV